MGGILLIIMVITGLIRVKPIKATKNDDQINFSHWGKGFTIDGSKGNDVITTGLGDDIIMGGDDNDYILSGDGDDHLDGGVGNDDIDGGFGRDVLIGGMGNDRLNGRNGADTYIFSKGHGQDIVMEHQWFQPQEGYSVDTVKFTDVDFEEVSLSIEDGGLVLSNYHKTDKLTMVGFLSDGSSHIENFEFGSKSISLLEMLSQKSINLSNQRDMINFTQWDNDFNINGQSGDDQMIMGGGHDTLFGGEGQDYLSSGNGNDVLDGGAGNDTLDGGSGDDVFLVGLGQDVIAGGAGADTAKFVVDFDGLLLADNEPVLKFHDFNISQMDKLDLSRLFKSDDINMDNITDYLILDTDNHQAHLKLDKDGLGDKYTAQNFIDLGYQVQPQDFSKFFQENIII